MISGIEAWLGLVFSCDKVELPLRVRFEMGISLSVDGVRLIITARGYRTDENDGTFLEAMMLRLKIVLCCVVEMLRVVDLMSGDGGVETEVQPLHDLETT